MKHDLATICHHVKDISIWLLYVKNAIFQPLMMLLTREIPEPIICCLPKYRTHLTSCHTVHFTCHAVWLIIFHAIPRSVFHAHPRTSFCDKITCYYTRNRKTIYKPVNTICYKIHWSDAPKIITRTHEVNSYRVKEQADHYTCIREIYLGNGPLIKISSSSHFLNLTIAVPLLSITFPSYLQPRHISSWRSFFHIQ